MREDKIRYTIVIPKRATGSHHILTISETETHRQIHLKVETTHRDVRHYLKALVDELL